MKFFNRIIAGAIALSFVGMTQSFTPYTDTSAVSSDDMSETLSEYVREIASIVNEERANNGLAPLTLCPELNAVSDIRAEELPETFDHVRPDGASWKTVLDENNIVTFSKGENILQMDERPQSIPEEAMRLWMNSTGHRANILDTDFTNIGIGAYYLNDTYYFVQIFSIDFAQWSLDGSALKINGSGKVPDYAFETDEWQQAKGNATEMTFGKNVTGIGQYVFYGMPALKSVLLPENVKSIDSGAFSDCKSLNEVTFMNPDCVINDSAISVSDNITIVGYENSTAQKFAESNNINFRSLGEVPVLSLGDLNGDGLVDSSDASIVLGEYAEISISNPSILTDIQKKSADVNNDSKIDSVDASLILSYYADKSTNGNLSFEEIISQN